MFAALKSASTLATLSAAVLAGQPGFQGPRQHVENAKPFPAPAPFIHAESDQWRNHKNDEADLDVDFTFVDGQISFSLDKHSNRWARDEHGVREALPFRLDLDAYRVGDEIILTARGENAAAGFTTTLQRARQHGKSVVVLRNFAAVSREACAQVLSPFEVAGTLDARSCEDEITVLVAGTSRCVRVRHIDAIPRLR